MSETMNQLGSAQHVDLGSARRRVMNPKRRYGVRFKHFRSRRRFVAFVVDIWTGAEAAHPTLYVMDPRLGRRPAKNQREAAQAAAELETAWNAGCPGATLEPAMLDKACEDLLAQKKCERRKSTVGVYRQVLTTFSEYLADRWPRLKFLDEVSLAVTRGYIAWRRKEHKRPDPKKKARPPADNATLNKELRHFRAAWKWWVNGGQALENPWLNIPWLREMPRDRVRFTLEQRERFLRTASDIGTKLQAAAAVAIDCGPRNDELCHLTWQHVDFAEASIRVTSEPCGWAPKDYQVRVMYFTPETGLLLRAWYASRLAEVARSAGTTPERAADLMAGMRVFGAGHTAGRDEWGSKFNRLLGDCCKKAGVPRIWAHDLRRTMARLADEAGSSLYDLQQALGHSSPVTTEKYIGKDQERAARRVGDRLARAVGGAKSGNNLVTPPESAETSDSAARDVTTASSET
jgi:integrase